ncbi:MAG: hypothetical protein Q7R87_04710 [Nanoarchaeota archaeon]|nr:hypothetical protein [Nanoarchaeota archaeon]
MVDTYIQLIDRIALAAGLPKEDIERKIEAKRAKLSGLVSKEGAAQIVAAELGINFEKEKLKISELLQGMKRANVIAKVIGVGAVREFNKNGREGKVANLVLADDSGNIKTVLWDTNHISLVEKGEVKEGDVIEISNGNIRNGELHLGSFSDIKKSKEKIANVQSEKAFENRKLNDAKSGQSLKTRAFIVQIFDPRYFEVCKECGKRVVEGECANHGKTESEKRALLTLVLDDGNESLKAVLFKEQIKMLGISEGEVMAIENFGSVKSKYLGEELVFSGSMRSNQLYNTNEMMIEKIEKVNPEEIINSFQKTV